MYTEIVYGQYFVLKQWRAPHVWKFILKKQPTIAVEGGILFGGVVDISDVNFDENMFSYSNVE